MQIIKQTIVAICLTALLMVASGGVEAAGCLKGALVGGVAGHFVGHHGLLGAAAGCIIGRHEAKKNRIKKVDSETKNSDSK